MTSNDTATITAQSSLVYDGPDMGEGVVINIGDRDFLLSPEQARDLADQLNEAADTSDNGAAAWHEANDETVFRGQFG